jgi:hypothetical protein
LLFRFDSREQIVDGCDQLRAGEGFLQVSGPVVWEVLQDILFGIAAGY